MLSDERIKQIVSSHPVNIDELAKLICLLRIRDSKIRIDMMFIEDAWDILKRALLGEAMKGNYIAASFSKLIILRNTFTGQLVIDCGWPFGDPEKVFPGLTEENFDDYKVEKEIKTFDQLPEDIQKNILIMQEQNGFITFDERNKNVE